LELLSRPPPHHGVTRPFVRQEILKRHSFDKSDQGATSANTIRKKISINALRNHKETASSSTRRPIYGFKASRATRSTRRSANVDSAFSSARNSEKANGSLELHKDVEIAFRATAIASNRAEYRERADRPAPPDVWQGSAEYRENLVLFGHAAA
jgi:hypothetical protein